MGNGIRDALLAALLFGLSTPIAKGLVGNLPPQFLAGLLYLGSGLGLTAAVDGSEVGLLVFSRLVQMSNLSNCAQGQFSIHG